MRGDVVEVQPANLESAYRVSFFGDEVEQITHFDPLTGEVYARLDHLAVFPATQYVTDKPTIERALDDIRAELDEQIRQFDEEGKALEAHRIRQRTEYDIEMMQELGYCNGIENYSRFLEGRPRGSRPHCLLDFLPRRLRLLPRRISSDGSAAWWHVRGWTDRGRTRSSSSGSACHQPLTTGRCASTSSASWSPRWSSSRRHPARSS